MIIDVSVSVIPQSSLTNSPASISFLTDISGQRVMPTPIFKQAFMLFMLENSRTTGLLFDFSSDRSKALL